MELGQRVYLPGCRRLVCKVVLNQPVVEEQFCDELPPTLPPGCTVVHRRHMRHPDCCPQAVCSPGNPLYPTLALRPQQQPTTGLTSRRRPADPFNTDLIPDENIRRPLRYHQTTREPTVTPHRDTDWRLTSLADLPGATTPFDAIHPSSARPHSLRTSEHLDQSKTSSLMDEFQFGSEHTPHRSPNLKYTDPQRPTSSDYEDFPPTRPVYDDDELTKTIVPEYNPPRTRNSEYDLTRKRPEYDPPRTRPEYDPPRKRPEYDPPRTRPEYDPPRKRPEYDPPRTRPEYDSPRKRPEYDPPRITPEYNNFPPRTTREELTSQRTRVTNDPVKTRTSPPRTIFVQTSSPPYTTSLLPKTTKPPSTPPTTPNAIFLTTDIVYGDGYSRPWNDHRDQANTDLPNSYNYHDPPGIWHPTVFPTLFSPNNNLYNLDYDTDIIRKPSEKGIDSLDDDGFGFRGTMAFTVTPKPQNFIIRTSRNPQADFSYTYYTDPSAVRTSPLPYQYKPDVMPLTKLFAATFPPNQSPAHKLSTNVITPNPHIRVVSRWTPVPSRTTNSPSKSKSTTPNTRWSTTPAEVTIPSSLSPTKESHYEIKSTTTSRVQPTTFRPHIKFSIPNTTPSTPPSRLTRPSFKFTKIPKRTTAEVFRATKRPNVSTISTPRPSDANDDTVTSPVSYEFASPKLDPQNHDIVEFIHTPLDPSALIPGHDEYVRSKTDAIKKYRSISSDEDETTTTTTTSTRKTRSLSYTPSTLPYDFTPVASDVLTSPTFSLTPLSLEPFSTDATNRQKRGRPVFYIPWRDNLVEMKPVVREKSPDDPLTLLSTMSFSSMKFDTSYFEQPDESSEKSNGNHLPNNAYTSISFRNVGTERTKIEEEDYATRRDKKISERAKDLARLQAIINGKTLENNNNNTGLITTLSPTTMGPPTTHATVTSTTPYTTIFPVVQVVTTSTPIPASPPPTTTTKEKSLDTNSDKQLHESLGGTIHTTATSARAKHTSQTHNTNQPQPKSQSNSQVSGTTVSLSSSQDNEKIVWSPPPFRPRLKKQHPILDDGNDDDVDIPVLDYGSFPEKDYVGVLHYESTKKSTKPPPPSTHTFLDKDSEETEEGNESQKAEVIEKLSDQQQLKDDDFSFSLPHDTKVTTKQDAIRKESHLQETKTETRHEYKPNLFGNGQSAYTTHSNSSRTVEKTENSFLESETYEEDFVAISGEELEKAEKDISSSTDITPTHNPITISTTEAKNMQTEESPFSTTKHQLVPRPVRTRTSAASNTNNTNRQRGTGFDFSKTSISRWFDRDSNKRETTTNPDSSSVVPQEDSPRITSSLRGTRISPPSSRLRVTEISRNKNKNNDGNVSDSDHPVPVSPPSSQRYPIPLRQLVKIRRITPKTSRTRGSRPRLIASRTAKTTEKPLPSTTALSVASSPTPTPTPKSTRIITTYKPSLVFGSATQKSKQADSTTKPPSSSGKGLQWNVHSETSTTARSDVTRGALSHSLASPSSSPQTISSHTPVNKLKTRRLRGQIPTRMVKRKRISPAFEHWGHRGYHQRIHPTAVESGDAADLDTNQKER
ncbi:hypothetical protein Pcinc_027106 [Petrolisthes cinctipes]|uniref:Uncharacterized protein n=1 Tax=Petrolisthes cinctipes TaxID=88211 RepID=A0AAE1KAQ2_PETCI|nr:hypothetical protein Pcinc_027106 [Petrolisthes cinctipes]